MTYSVKKNPKMEDTLKRKYTIKNECFYLALSVSVANGNGKRTIFICKQQKKEKQIDNSLKFVAFRSIRQSVCEELLNFQIWVE